MSFFEIVGMAVTGVVALYVVALMVLHLIRFIGYQVGARNYRDYIYRGPDKSQWFWTKLGIKTWKKSFLSGSGWYVVTTDPEDNNFELHIYENGRIFRNPSRYTV
jgi:alpha-N-acetylglucosamine transferase